MSVIFPIHVDPRFRVSTAVGGQTTFSVPFPFQVNADIAVVRFADADDLEGLELTEGLHYTLTGAGNTSGGSVSLTVPATAGERYLRIGSAVLDRLRSVVRDGRFSSKAIDDDMDRWIIIAQELSRDLARAWKAPLGQTPGHVIVGAPGSVARFDELGNLVQGPAAADIEQAQEYAGAAGEAADRSVAAADRADEAAEHIEELAASFVELATTFKTVTALLADTSMAYSGADIPVVVAAGDIVRAASFRYQVAASAASNHHVITAGGIKLYALPDSQGVHNVLAFGAKGDDVTDDWAACQKAADTGLNVHFPKGYTFRINQPIAHKATYQVFIIDARMVAGAAINAIVRSVDFDYCGVTGWGQLDGNTIATNCIHFLSDTKNTIGCFVENVEVRRSTEDITLQRGGILFDNTGGKAGAIRNKKARITNVRVNNCRTHGILIAYTDGVTIVHNEIDGVRNHGHESVNCSDVLIANNNVKNCETSGLGVGDNCRNWLISNNVIDNCAGDGAITCEHNCVRGGIVGNQVYNSYGASCINVSFGTPVAGDFATIHDITVADNHCHAKSGFATIRGLLMYASTSGSEGFAMEVRGNTFDNVFLGLDINYITHSHFADNTVTSFQGSTTVGPTGRTAAKFTDLRDSTISGFAVKAATSDHALQLLGASSLQCEHVIISNIRVGVTPNSKSAVYIDGGIFFNVYGVTARSANYAVEVATGGTAYQVGGITGSFVSGLTVGGSKGTWQA